MQNIELKIEVGGFGEILGKLKKNRASRKGILRQTDTYYNCHVGRLKFREENNQKFMLVFYQRPDQKEAKVSDFEILEFSKKQTADLKTVLNKAYGEKVIVKKKRTLWMYKNTRIHLDAVAGLGTFLELETLVKKNMATAKKEYAEVVKLLDLSKYKKLEKSYSDMLLKK